MVAFVQSRSASPGSSTTTSLAYNSAVTAGDTLVVFVRVGAAISGVSVSDSVNGAWTSAINTDTVGDSHIVGYFQNTASGTPTVTVSWTTSGSIRLGILEYGGVAASSLDQGPTYASFSGAAGVATSPSVTTTVASEVLIVSLERNAAGGANTDNGSGSNPSSGWTNRVAVDVSKLWVSDVVVSSTGTYQDTINWVGIDDGSFYILSLKGSAAVTSPIFPIDLNQPIRIKSLQAAAFDGINLSLYAPPVIGNPFFNPDFSKPFDAVQISPFVYQSNIALLSPPPVVQLMGQIWLA